VKSRSGFVSNSSSSSFIIAGIKVKSNSALCKLLRDEDGDSIDGEIAIHSPEYNDTESVVGVWAGSSDRGCIEELNLEHLQKCLKSANSLFEELKAHNPKVAIDLNKIKLYTIGE
jgi:hypothetical protein